MRRCYLAGPMRSKPAFNYPAFFAGEERLRATGWDEVWNPARMDVVLDNGGAPTDLSIAEQNAHAGAPMNARRYAKRDAHILIDVLRVEEGDAIVVLPDWEESTGAKAEVAIARWVGLPVLTLEEATR
jgi:hypothetical protein